MIDRNARYQLPIKQLSNSKRRRGGRNVRVDGTAHYDGLIAVTYSCIYIPSYFVDDNYSN